MAAKNNKALGQHWLKNREILDEIADEASALDFAEKCVEIGPGLGTLTSSLLKRFKSVTAVEFDTRLAENLPKSFPGKNLEVINADILKFDFSTIKEPYVVVGNIPYYITSPIIEKVLSVSNLPKRVVLLMQKEVAERILDEKESGLSLFVKNRADVEPGILVPKEEFTPPPKVDSAVLIMTPHAPKYDDELFKFIRLAFVSPRKKLLRNLAPLKSKEELVKIFTELGISTDARPADLHLDTYFALFSAIM
ncbi:ribosomal RNA small subunit methyltransferase A [Candidatus Saccharibacteria bacterium]|nr:ribosomal RNA small subunit methyltransferase A [Candidatus Saccharibacteria bacterium]